ncbi:MAG: hypothetical protein IH899_18115 [Planctomycetes bacterium]|nr:hypothetical protein [Planctomycetota bacterium]
MANVLKKEKQLLCLKMLCEGSSIRSVERTTDVHRDTVMRLMVRFGDACGEFLDRELRNIETAHCEIDEQWCWVAKKQGKLTASEKNDPLKGDQYLYLSMEQKSRLIINYRIGKRNEETTAEFMDDLRKRIVLPESVNVP